MQITELYQLYTAHPNVQTDTRKLQQGDMYFALKGDNFNGNTFAQQALNAGAAYCIIDEQAFYINEKTIVVENVLQTLQDLAKHHRQQFTIPFIAITGSNGKTTTKELLNAVLCTTYITYYTEGNLNNHIGVPLTLLKIKADAQMAIIEMGANHLHEIESYCSYTLPTHGLINNCGMAHLEGFGGIEGVRKGKGELYDFIRKNNGIIFRNTDLPYLQTMSIGIEKQITYGSADADFTGKVIQNNSCIDVEITTQKLACTVHTQLVGNYNLGNILGAIAVGSTFGVPIEKIKTALENYAPSNSRSQLIQQGSNTIILDAYNANPTSMQAAIENFVSAPYAQKVLMLGGMWELGTESIAQHQKIIDLINQTNWHAVVLVGGDFEKTTHAYTYLPTALAAKEWLATKHFTDSAILVKGSRATAMERVLG